MGSDGGTLSKKKQDRTRIIGNRKQIDKELHLIADIPEIGDIGIENFHWS